MDQDTQRERLSEKMCHGPAFPPVTAGSEKVKK